MKRGPSGLTKILAGALSLFSPACDSVPYIDRLGGQDFGDTIFSGYDDPTGLPPEEAGSYARDIAGGGYSTSTPLENVLGAPDGRTTTFFGGAGFVLTFNERPDKLTFYAEATERTAVELYAVAPVTFLKPREGEIIANRFYVLDSEPIAHVVIGDNGPYSASIAEARHPMIYVEFADRGDNKVYLDSVKAN